MDKAEAIERLEYLKARMQIALEQEVPEWVAEDVLNTIEAYDMAIEALRGEPKRGEWIVSYTDDHGIKKTECSACGVSFITYDVYGWEYCPWCGAKMDGERKESE